MPDPREFDYYDFEAARLELVCERLECGKAVMEGFKAGGEDGPFHCSLACLAEEGHDPAEAYDTTDELGWPDA